jgi:hypothetical protein
MSQQNDTGFVTGIAAGAIPQFARVKETSTAGTYDVAGLADRSAGIAQRAAFAAGDPLTIALWNKPGTFKAIAKEAFARGAKLYSEAGGKLQDTAETTSFAEAVALEAATAENDIVEVRPIFGDEDDAA